MRFFEFAGEIVNVEQITHVELDSGSKITVHLSDNEEIVERAHSVADLEQRFKDLWDFLQCEKIPLE